MNKISFILLLGILLLVACTTPRSKEAYLKHFEEFIQRVDENHNDYKRKDWEWADSRFDKYNTEWYEKYKDDLTDEEQLQVKAWILKYYSLKGRKGMGKFLNDLLKDIDVDGMSEKVQEYVDKELDGDIENLVNGVTDISDSVINVIEDVVDQLDDVLEK